MSEYLKTEALLYEPSFGGFEVSSWRDLPASDNLKGSHLKMLELNEHYRNSPWEAPFDETIHQTHLGDARDMQWIADESACSSRRGLNPYNRRFGKRSIKLSDFIQIMKQFKCVRFPSSRVTPSYCLLVWVKINSYV